MIKLFYIINLLIAILLFFSFSFILYKRKRGYSYLDLQLFLRKILYAHFLGFGLLNPSLPKSFNNSMFNFYIMSILVITCGLSIWCSRYESDYEKYVHFQSKKVKANNEGLKNMLKKLKKENK